MGFKDRIEFYTSIMKDKARKTEEQNIHYNIKK